MGSKLFQELTGLRPPGHSHPIGTIARRQKATATLSYVDSLGEVVFGPEAPIEIEFAWRQLPPEREESGERRVLVGFEIQTRDRAMKDCTAVLSTYPYSTDWFDWADFKRTLNRGREERERLLRAPTETVVRRLRSRAELGVEVLETRAGRLTARLSIPIRTAGLAIRSRRGLKSRDVWMAVDAAMNGRYGRDKRLDLWCFGACRDFERCREFLRISDHATRVLERTQDGTLFRQAQGRAPRLDIGTEARALAGPVLESSIIKALAGESPKLLTIGSPRRVSRLMEGIYLDTMYNLARRLRERESGGRVWLKDIERTVAAPVPSEKPFDEQIDFFREELKRRRPPEEIRYAIEAALSSKDAAERESACAALIAWQEAGYRVPRALEPRLKAIAGDPTEPSSLRKAARLVLRLMRCDSNAFFDK